MFRDSFPCKIEKRWGRYQHGFNCHNQKPRPTIGGHMKRSPRRPKP